ncbi:hypothetical protein Tco_0586173, partial [Tanacetum coccineum]
MDFTILENIETNIDPSLSNVVFGRPFVEIACLAINRKYGLMTFTDGIKEITFKTPYKDSERSELSSEVHDLLSSRVILSEDDYDRGCRKPSDLEDGFYRDTIKLGPEYLTGINDEGEVTFILFSSLPGVLTPVRGESLKILNGFDVSLPVSHSLWSSQSFSHQKAINGFDMPLPVAICSGLVNSLLTRYGKGPDWMFDLDILTPSLNYIPVRKENQVDTAVNQSNSVDFEDVDEQQFIVHGSSSFGNTNVLGAIPNDAQNKDFAESTIVKEVLVSIENQDLQKEFKNLMLQETNLHSQNQGI